MKISVIIPAINEEAEIAAAVQSAVIAGAYDVVVADGGSTDATIKTAEAAGAQTVVAPPGRASQQNAGASQCRGDVLLFLHADCRLPKAAAGDVSAALSCSNGCVGGFFQQRIDHPGRIYRWIESGNRQRADRLGWAYGDQAIFVRRTVFEDIGAFPQIDIMEDLFLMKRLKRCGSLACIDEPIVVSARRWEERGTIRQTLRNWAMLIAANLGVSPSILARFYPRAT